MTKIPIKKAMIRGPTTGKECPFGLPITLGCKHAGDSVKKMQSLQDAPEEQRDKYRKANRKVYRHHKEDRRCVYADKIVEGKDFVHCDFGDYGEGLRDFPIRPSPFYPRVFSGIGQTGLYVYPVGSYWDNTAAQQLFSGIFSMYASTGEVLFKKLSANKPDKLTLELYHEIDGIFEG